MTIYDEDLDFCPTCGEYIDIEVDVFATSFFGRYKAHCLCTAEAAKRRAAEEESGSYSSAWNQPTIGDLLHLNNEEK